MEVFPRLGMPDRTKVGCMQGKMHILLYSLLILTFVNKSVCLGEFFSPLVGSVNLNSCRAKSKYFLLAANYYQLRKQSRKQKKDETV